MPGEQIPAFPRATAAAPGGPYDVGCLYIGVNDVRAPRLGPVAGYERDAPAPRSASSPERCERTLACHAAVRSTSAGHGGRAGPPPPT